MYVCVRARARFLQRALVSSINSIECSVFVRDMECALLEVRYVLPYATWVHVYFFKIQK